MLQPRWLIKHLTARNTALGCSIEKEAGHETEVLGGIVGTGNDGVLAELCLRGTLRLLSTAGLRILRL